uniref:Proline rich membrane anchor 1 n=1 Tax=Pelusios castaneus TaxID=367368 RepID=A0A8C8RYN1_9SAUR
MPVRELRLPLHYCWPALLLHWALHSLWGCIQVMPSWPQSTYSIHTGRLGRLLGRLPLCRPSPPPPPAGRAVVESWTPKSTFCPTEETWWPGLVIIIAVCCTTLVLLFVAVIICYKAIKRKPLRKEENGTSRAEYAMTSSQNNKTVDNAVV